MATRNNSVVKIRDFTGALSTSREVDGSSIWETGVREIPRKILTKTGIISLVFFNLFQSGGNRHEM